MSSRDTLPPSDERDARIGALLNDFLDRRARGEALSEQDLLAGHPDLAAELRQHLELLRDLRPAADRIDALIAQGILTRSADPRYPAELGAYKIAGYIGRGGMGLVFRACEESLNRTVALKILRPELADDAQALARFVREARAAAGLQHPNIVTVYAVGQERGVHFIAMEHVAGLSLAELIRRDGPLPAAAAARLFRELLSGLAAAHGAGLIHRDIKSSNILLAGRELRVKIADFGLARVRSTQTRLTLAASVIGTPDYMSPEQARGDGHLDHRADLYSAGVVLYEMLSGRTPFTTESATATIHRILRDQPAHPRTLSAGADPVLASLALRLMAKRPEDRFASATEVLAALDANVRVPLPRTRSRRRRQLLAAGGVLASCALAAWWLAAGQGGQPAAPPRVADFTRVSADPDRPTLILAHREPDGATRVFREFPPGTTTVAAAVAADLSGAGELAVVAGFATPLDGANLVAYDRAGAELWRHYLYSDRQWPDCDPPAQWGCCALAAGDLDGQPGEELVAVASDILEYATCICTIDPRTGALGARFWHQGDIQEVLIQPDFFGPGRPALVAVGQNNKFDGYDSPRPDDPPAWTQFQFTPAVMILDPRTMEGVGPPWTNRHADLPRARVHAYAVLDMAPGAATAYYPPDGAPARPPDAPEQATIARLARPPYDPDGTEAASAPWFLLDIAGDYPLRPRAILTVDRDLELRRIVPVVGELAGSSRDFWRARWHVVVRAGVALPPPAAAAAGPPPGPALPTPAVTPGQPADELTAVWCDSRRPTTILAQRRHAPAPLVFHEFPPAAGELRSVLLVDAADVDGRPAPLVVAGTTRPVDGCCLFAFDPDGRQRWRLNLSSERQWPDCGPPTMWGCIAVVAADLDGHPGAELVAVAGDPYEYPSRVSLIAPATGEVRATFWHLGDLTAVEVAERFFASQRPAILLAGYNNKLDGFRDPRPDDPAPVAKYDYVSVAIILDPTDMDGVGPPFTSRLADLPAARPYAYAFLDRPSNTGASYVPPGQSEPVFPAAADVVWIDGFGLGAHAPDEASGPWLLVALARLHGRTTPGYLMVDRWLNLRDVVVSSRDMPARTLAAWKPHWRPLIREGRYVDTTQVRPAGPAE